MKIEYEVYPIGKVVKEQGRTILDLASDFHGGLLGLEGFSHVVVLYWFDRNDSPDRRTTLQVHPRADTRNPLTGVFACRSPRRPNLLGHETCKIERIENGRVIVDGIDAFDGSPIIDLKPHMPSLDCVPSATVPDWVGTGRED